MILMLPLSSDLRLNKIPFVSYAIVIVCLLIFINQRINNVEIAEEAIHYCETIDFAQLNIPQTDTQYNTDIDCVLFFRFLHERADHGELDRIRTRLQNDQVTRYTDDEIDQIILNIENHLVKFQLSAPASLNGKIMHFPDELDIIAYITSSIAHADWLHIFGNLIFFLAFAPALEILIDNRLKFFTLLIAISFVTAITYSLTVIASGEDPMPTLGLSGIVMGMIGLSAFLMPHARIKVFIWILIFFKTVFIPAWILALWFIGFDIYDMVTSDGTSGINFVAHVSGGLSGYALGFIWFKQRREQFQDELNDEIESMRLKRSLGSAELPSNALRKERDHQQEMQQLENDFDRYTTTIFKYVRVKQDSHALALFIKENDIRAANVAVYEEHFKEVKEWGPSRYCLCVGRLIIDLLMQQNKQARALFYVEECHKVLPKFALGDPHHVLFLANLAIDLQNYKLAYLLVKDAEKRYGNYVEFHQCALLEVELLWQYLNEPDKAKEKVDSLLAAEDCPLKTELLQQLKLMEL